MSADQGLSYLPFTWKERIIVDDKTGCWCWSGAWRLRHDGRYRSARVIVYEYLVGVISSGHALKCACKNTRCVNPGHMQQAASLKARITPTLGLVPVPVEMPVKDAWDTETREATPDELAQWASWNWLSDLGLCLFLVFVAAVVIFAVIYG